MSYIYIDTEMRDGIFILTLNRPDKRNALNTQMWLEITQAIEEFEAQDDARVLVITNNGPCFCAGSDLKEISTGEYHPPIGHEDEGFATITGHYIDKPVIAAVEGMCMGGGAEILLACDMGVISSDCIIGYPEVKRGLVAGGGAGILRLAQAIPVKYALELLLTGDNIDAETAVRWGLANRIAEPGHVLDEALVLARAIARNAPIAVRLTKKTVYENLNESWLRGRGAGWDAALNADISIKETEDAHEGSTAFAEKRTPEWKNR
ncbi:MAG: enoyl-CoA hydratase-related protein [Coriobacteriia bacterium]|nr:enoyl-CoA hydratase-related protein [Coriobacteriia bacterium]